MFAEMLINGVDINVYNARLQTYSVSGTSLANNLSTVNTLLRMPSLFSTTLGTRTLTITLTFKPSRHGSDSRGMSVAEKLATAAENITRFEAEIVGKTVEITLPDGYIYTSLATALPAATFDSSGEHDVTYTFSAIRHFSEDVQAVEPNGKVFCKSTTKTPVKFVVSVPTAADSLTVFGITVKNVTANAEIIIDGIDGIVTMNGANKLLDTDLIDFPYLNPGYNIVSCSDTSASIKVIYTPVYV